MAVTTTQEFLDLLAKSELLSAAKLEEARRNAGGQADPKAAARELIRLNLLTKWQAGVLCGGNSKLKLGKYTLLEQLGTEDIGLVFLAEHAQMGRKVVIKTLSNKYTNNAEAVKRFLSEAQRIAALHHRNIIHLFDVSSEGDRYYIVLENAEGRDFQSLVAADGPVARELVAEYLIQAAEGLSHAHSKSLYHGDIKPENIMVDGSGQVKIMNFGVARLVETADKPADAVTDLAALGNVGTFLLTGKPGLGERKSAPPGIETLCLKMTTKNAAERFASADEASAALKKWVAEQKTVASSGAAPKIGRTAAVPVAKAKPEPPKPKPKPPAIARRQKDPAPPPEPEPVAEPAEERINIVIGGPGKVAVAEKKKPKKAAAVVAPVKPAETPDAESAGEESPKVAARKLPLALLIGGGAGAGLLAMLLLVAGLAFFFWPRGETEVTQNDPQQEEPAKEDPDAELKNPETKIAEPAPEPEKEPEPPPPEPVPEPAKPEPPPVTPPVEPVKPDPPKEPVPPPMPKPEPTKNPFTALATTIELPKLESATTPTSLGPLPVQAKDLFFMDLAGGDKAGSTGKLAFTMKTAKGGTADRDWEISMSGSDSGGAPVVATLAAKDDELKFQWTDKGVADPNSNQLRNCVLSARTGAFSHSLALRKPVEAAPLTVTLEKAMKVDYAFEYPPDPASIEVEITSLEGGFPKHKFEPKASFEARKDGADILLGNDKEETLILKVDSQMRKNVSITVTPWFRLSSQPKEAKYTNALWTQAVRTLTQQNAICFNAVDQVNKNKNPTPAELQFKSQAEQNLAKCQAAMKQVEEMKTTHAAIDKTGKIHFRVYYKAGDQQVDLVRTSAAPAAQPGK